MPKISRNLIIWLIVLVAVIAIFFTIISPGGGAEKLGTAELISKIHKEGGDVTIKGSKLTAVIDGTTYEATIPESFDAFQEFEGELGGTSPTVALNYEGESGWGRGSAPSRSPTASAP